MIRRLFQVGGRVGQRQAESLLFAYAGLVGLSIPKHRRADKSSDVSHYKTKKAGTRISVEGIGFRLEFSGASGRTQSALPG